MFVHDANYRILRCNAAYAAKVGLAMSAIVGQPYWQLFPRSDGPPGSACDATGTNESATFTLDTGQTFSTHTLVAHRPSGAFWYCRHLLVDITERQRIERDLAHERLMSNAIIESAANAFFLLDQEAKLVRWNSNLKQRMGRSDDELRGFPILSLVHENDRAMAQAKLLTAFATGYTSMEIRAANGPYVYLATARRVVADGVPFIAGFCTDITSHTEREQSLESRGRFSDTLIANIPGVVCVVDVQGNYVRWNSNLNRLTGLSDEELKGRMSLLDVVEEDRPQAASQLREAIEHGLAKAILRIATRDQGVRAFLTTGRRFHVGEEPYIVGVGIDLTDQLAQVAALQHDAQTDPLTEVANRGHFIERATDEFARCRRYGHPLAVWMLDIDHFKAVNDTYGHQAGDAVLRSFVAVCRQAVRDWDILGRMGGEEFAVVLPETEARQALLAAERLRQSASTVKVPIGGEKSVSVTVSIGVAAMRDDDEDVHCLLARADEALYNAKRTGRDKVCAV